MDHRQLFRLPLEKQMELVKTKSEIDEELYDNSEYKDIHQIKIVGKNKLDSEIDFAEKLCQGSDKDSYRKTFMLFDINKDENDYY